MFLKEKIRTNHSTNDWSTSGPLLNTPQNDPQLQNTEKTLFSCTTKFEESTEKNFDFSFPIKSHDSVKKMFMWFSKHASQH